MQVPVLPPQTGQQGPVRRAVGEPEPAPAGGEELTLALVR